MKIRKRDIVITLLIVATLFTPIPLRYKDGGTVKYQAFLYEIVKYHQLDLNSESGYKGGWSMKILGIEIYNNFDE